MFTIAEDVKNSVAWLQNSKEPWTEVVKHWKNTTTLRKPGHTSASTVAQFLEEWPVLKLKLGYTLVIIHYGIKMSEEMYKLNEKYVHFIFERT